MNGRQLSDHICRTLRDRGHQAYLAGGCVRDILLRREPVDYDVATDATPDRVQELFPKSLAVGAKFGVVIVTDGVVEAVNQSEEEYGERRLLPCLQIAPADASAADVLRRVMLDVNTFVGHVRQHDDITCLVLRVTA